MSRLIWMTGRLVFCVGGFDLLMRVGLCVESTTGCGVHIRHILRERMERENGLFVALFVFV